ncbi:MAG: hypothetical protein IJ106_08130 [Parasporobacterium sp.]|nr:hypothetical protein [Parasporobacterium sp.]
MNHKDFLQTGIAGLYKEELSAADIVTAGDLNRMMQRVTENSMERLGVTVSDLMDRNLLWVICFSQIQVTRMPEPGESLEIYTWPGAPKLGMYTRRYVFFTKDGEELLQAASLFSLVNQKTREMVLPSDANIIFPVVQMPEEMKLPKMTLKGPEATSEVRHLVESGEIDINDHVNNAFYLDWCTDILAQKAPDSAFQAGSIWISYAREIRPREEVSLQYSQEKGRLFVKGYVQGEHCFTMDMQLH